MHLLRLSCSSIGRSKHEFVLKVIILTHLDFKNTIRPALPALLHNTHVTKNSARELHRLCLTPELDTIVLLLFLIILSHIVVYTSDSGHYNVTRNRKPRNTSFLLKTNFNKGTYHKQEFSFRHFISSVTSALYCSDSIFRGL